MADEHDSIDDVLDDPSIDAQALDAIAATLAGLTFLDSSHDVTGEPMPPAVWARLSEALADEAAARSGAAADNVVPLPPRAEHAEHRALRWVGGLVAASVVLVALGVGVSTLSLGGGSGEAIVAGDAPVTLASSDAAGAAGAAAKSVAPVPEAFAAESAAPQSDLAAAQPARMVMASNVNYTRAGLTDQVATLLDEVDVHTPEEASLMPVTPVALPIEGGFTQSWETLRACLTWLAKSAQAQALVVDRATYEGADAGVVVAPASQVDPATSPPPTTTVASPMGTLDVWVVRPECQQVQDGILEHVPYVLVP